MSKGMVPAVKRQHGFTLIELMVVVAILAIIASIAVNAFSGAGNDANRSRGMADISALNDAMVRYYATAYTYNGATLGALTAASGLALSPNYGFSIVIPADGQSYSVRAVPTAAGGLAGDGALSIDNIGRRCYFPGNDAPNFATCPKPF